MRNVPSVICASAFAAYEIKSGNILWLPWPEFCTNAFDTTCLFTWSGSSAVPSDFLRTSGPL